MFYAQAFPEDFATVDLKKYAGVAQLVERNLAKVDVAGSNPVSRLNEATAYGIIVNVSCLAEFIPPNASKLSERILTHLMRREKHDLYPLPKRVKILSENFYSGLGINSQTGFALQLVFT